MNLNRGVPANSAGLRVTNGQTMRVRCTRALTSGFFCCHDSA